MTEKNYIPKGLRAVNPYLTVANASELLSFVERAFDAEILERHDHEGRVAHAKVRIDDSVIEVSDASGEWKPMPCALHLYIPNVNETHKRALEAGATELYPPTEHEYGERGSGLRDPAGNHWWLATALP